MAEIAKGTDDYCALWESEIQTREEAEKNEPLTLDELREMDGEPVWVVCLTNPDLSCWGFHDEDGVCGYCANFNDDDYRKTWLAYRRKPGREET